MAHRQTAEEDFSGYLILHLEYHDRPEIICGSQIG